jgi:type I site-specific restriction-modification system R (restriction) subunit
MSLVTRSIFVQEKLLNMLHEITWKDYWTLIKITSLIYWLIIVSFFYRQEILLLAKRKKNNNGEGALATSNESNNKVLTMQQPFNFPGNDSHETNLFEEDFDEQELLEINVTPHVHALAEDIKEQIKTAQEKEWVKEELVFALQHIIKTYPQLKETSYKKEINNLIASECENHRSIHLSAEELNMLWVS